jgi:hypothetical protein
MNVKRLEETLVKSEIFLRTPNEKFAVFDAGVCQLGTASSCLARSLRWLRQGFVRFFD